MAGKGRPKGTPKTGGRTKGSVNRSTKEMREALLKPFDQKKFVEWALANPELYFTKIVMGLMPRDVVVSSDEDNPLFIAIRKVSDVNPGN